MDSETSTSSTRIFARLYPISVSAHYAANLSLNANHIRTLKRSLHPQQPPSPACSIDEQDGPSREEISTKASAKATTSGLHVLLQQTRNANCVAMGSAWQNYFVLQAEESSEASWVARVHCEFFPDPDSSDVWLKNPSGIHHTIRHSIPGSKIISIGPGQRAPMQPGSWSISLGEGWEFECEILPHDPAAPSNTALIGVGNNRSSGRQINKKQGDAPKTRATSTDALQQKPKGKEQALDRVRESYSQLEPDDEQDILGDRRIFPKVAETVHSLVSKQRRGGVIRAVKKCRRSDIPEAADMWQQEVNMLLAVGKHVRVLSSH